MHTTKINQRRNNQIVQGVWTVDLFPEEDSSKYYYPPNNSAEIIVVLEGEISRKSIGSPYSNTLKKNKIYLSNIRSKGTVLTPKQKASILVLKLNPSTQKIFMNEGLLYARDKILELDLPVQNTFVWKKYIATKNIRKILEFVDNFITHKNVNKSLKKDQTVFKSIKIMKKKNGNVLVKDIYTQMGVCKSTLEDKFNKDIGISPKEFCKIEKLNHFFANTESNDKQLTLTELAYKSGYYDQSHLIKDFKFYLDDSPKRFLSKQKRILI